MKRQDSRKTHAGFTLLELIVVIGIIAILIGALTPWVLRSRSSALTAKCKNNLHNLAQATISWTTQSHSDQHAHFPAAGFYRSIDSRSRRRSYYPHRPWISNKGDIRQLNQSTTSVVLGDVAHFTDSEDDIRTAVTNGAIWHAVGSSFEVYRCPVHVNEFEKKRGRPPGWSYMMNQEFGFNRNGMGQMPFFGASANSSSGIKVATDDDGERNTTAWRAYDKVLLFAEIQGIDIEDSGHGVSLKAVNGGSEADAVLEYTTESMGFNHDMGRHQYGGNVAFADGHAETIILPKSMDRKDLTRYLCQGYDVPHDGRSYNPTKDDK